MSDVITKTAVLAAPLARVWEAVSDARQFGAWFGAEFDGPFVAGARVGARIVPTTVDADVAAMQAPHAGVTFDVWVEAVEPMRRLAFRWHPYDLGGQDPATAPTTLVELVLDETPEGTRLTLRESGFERVPLEKRAAAFTANEEGWALQARLVTAYLASRP
ncbi:MAG: SRPBCC family protein [Vicinamibacterales bacterium]